MTGCPGSGACGEAVQPIDIPPCTAISTGREYACPPYGPVASSMNVRPPASDGVLLVTFDEGELSDQHCGGNPDPDDCGGHIWHVLIGPNVKHNYQSNTHYFQGSQLRMFCDLLGLTSCPGDGATSPPMSEFFR